MNSVRHPAILLKTLASALSFLFFTASLSAQTPSFVSFDAPGAGTGSGQGTFVVGMNSTGAIVGNYFDNSFTSHGYVRQPNGYFTEFTPPNLSHVFLYGINDSGQVIGNGQLTVPPYGTVGFIRDPDGKYTIVSIAGSSNFTVTAINNNGEVTGYFFGSDNRFHGFVRDAVGNMTEFEDPNATKATGNGTFAWVINDQGWVGGYYNYNNITGVNRAFIRDLSGDFTNFDAVSGGSGQIEVLAINRSGEVTGYYGDPVTLITHCFLRDPAGNITDFDISGSSASIASGLNDSGEIVGYWMVQNQLLVDSFVHDAAGNITTFAAPANNYGTFAVSINNNGRIAGDWWDNLNFVYHGFLK